MNPLESKRDKLDTEERNDNIDVESRFGDGEPVDDLNGNTITRATLAPPGRQDMSGSSAASATLFTEQASQHRRHPFIISSKLPSIRPFYGIVQVCSPNYFENSKVINCFTNCYRTFELEYRTIGATGPTHGIIV